MRHLANSCNQTKGKDNALLGDGISNAQRRDARALMWTRRDAEKNPGDD
jgi:hypothetical protein